MAAFVGKRIGRKKHVMECLHDNFPKKSLENVYMIILQDILRECLHVNSSKK
jgi:hypothetical protein